jgi:hypothetical protein
MPTMQSMREQLARTLQAQGKLAGPPGQPHK